MIRAAASLVSSLVLITLPTLTVWLASSLIAFHGGPRELALVGGLLVFPLLPALWEWRATRAWKLGLQRRKQFVGTPKRLFSGFTRLALRTLFICLAFTGAMVAKFPKVTFAALATRGDWFLAPGDAGEPWRTHVFQLAGGLEGLHRLANPNPYVTKIDGEAIAKIDPAPTPIVPTGPSTRWRKLTEDERAQIEGVKPKPPPEPVRPSVVDAGVPDEGYFSVITWKDDDGIAKLRENEHPDAPPAPDKPDSTVIDSGGTHWPWANEISPVVATMHPHDETSIAAVAQYIRSREPNAFKRVKALHDWVVTRLEYDHDSLKPGQRKPQDANTVFVNRVGVCEGYARLMVELGRQTGDQIIYLGGDVREENGSAAPIGHAWNAVEIDRHWYLVDTTWDDPTTPDGRNRSYRTDYLFIPPSVAIWSHFPDDARWQLLDKPLSRGDFLRQPFARPGIAREGLTLTSPSRAAVDSGDSLEVVLENPLHRYLMIKYRTATGRQLDCANTNAERVSTKCPVPDSGEALIFSNDEQYGQYDQVVRITVTRR